MRQTKARLLTRSSAGKFEMTYNPISTSSFRKAFEEFFKIERNISRLFSTQSKTEVKGNLVENSSFEPITRARRRI